MASSWGLGTNSSQVADTGNTATNLLNVTVAPLTVTRMVAQRRALSGALWTDRLGRFRSWQIQQEALTDTEKDNLLALLDQTVALYFRDDWDQAVYEVAVSGEIQVEPTFGLKFNVSYQLVGAVGTQ